MKERLIDSGYAMGWRLVRVLPASVVRRLFAAGAVLAARRRGPGTRQLVANLRRVVGGEPSDALVHAALRSYARYWLEIFRLPVLDRRAVVAATRCEGAHHLATAYAQGRGVILVLPHMGNWDVAGIWLIEHGMPFITVAERLKPESLYRRFVAFREGLGMEVLPLSGGEQGITELLATRLRAGRVICLLGDRDLTRSGIEVTFFGEPTTMPAGPALLAATTGAPLLPAGLWFDGAGWAHRIGAPIPIPTEGRLRERIQAATQALADFFGAEIAAHPADWHMLQRLWLADRDPIRRRRAAPSPARLAGGSGPPGGRASGDSGGG